MSEPSGCLYCGAGKIEGRTNHWECGSSFSEKGGPLQGLICRINELEKENSELHAHYTQAPNAFADSYFDLELNGDDAQMLRTMRAWMKGYHEWRDQSPSDSLGKEIQALCGEMDKLESRNALLEAVASIAKKLRLCFPDEAPAAFDVPRYIIDEFDEALDAIDKGAADASN